MVLPCASVMVIMVLLNEAFTCATPETMFLRSRRRTRVASLAILLVLQTRPSCQALGRKGHPVRVADENLLLLAGDRLRLALAGAGVRVRALTANRQAAAVTQATIGAEVHQALDVHGHFTAKVTFHDVVAVDGFADSQNLGVGQLIHAALGRDVDLLDDLLGLLGP